MHHYIHLPSTKVADVFNNMKEYKTSKNFISFYMPISIMVLSLILCILDGEIDIISLVLLFIIFTSLFYVTIVDKNYYITIEDEYIIINNGVLSFLSRKYKYNDIESFTFERRHPAGNCIVINKKSGKGCRYSLGMVNEAQIKMIVADLKALNRVEVKY
jgi:hypothetical protein